ncbi:AI-2E family transporter [Cupriavidus respiraculi]|uniref:Transport protein YdiK n=1 Tax=Cupriavidus respiraculi TaxID=195930 RepID=A0ABN7ZBB1_9BURK|nr:AI-2E family transporter [Cupriavidus respiraculi]CAG9181661.1 Putative transport protein YdiK [Cupriavidus respiraculi]
MRPMPLSEWTFSRGMLDVLIRAGLIAVLAIFCFRIFYPFLDIVLWSVILAVTMYPLQVRMRRRLGMRDGRSATLIVLVSLALIMVPAYVLGVALLESVENAMHAVRNESIRIPPPPDFVAGWPLFGQRLHAAWLSASTDMTGMVEKFLPQFRGITMAVLGKLASLGVALLVFVLALFLAGIIMAYGEEGHRSALRIAARVFGAERGPRIALLCTATIRAVAQGVVGIAFIQMLLIGIAFVVKGVPAAGLLALLVLLLGIMQLPATLITLPVIAYVFYTDGVNLATVIFAAYVFVAGLADNVLKPLMLGRGVDVPMPVVLIGALGGMVTGGVIGLFIGPVVLSVGYRLFWLWVDEPPLAVPADEPTARVSP